jgi:hypothetical protein
MAGVPSAFHAAYTAAGRMQVGRDRVQAWRSLGGAGGGGMRMGWGVAWWVCRRPSLQRTRLRGGCRWEEIVCGVEHGSCGTEGVMLGG